jgi:hypothetical protein
MKEWFQEYRRLFVQSRMIGIIGSVFVIVLILGELAALQHAIEMYEEPILPDTIWWNVFKILVVAILLIVSQLLRSFVLFRRSYSWVLFGTWILSAGLFIAYFVFLLEPPLTCSPDGMCFYHSQRRDNIGLAAIVFFGASFVRSVATGALAYLNVSSKLK